MKHLSLKHIAPFLIFCLVILLSGCAKNELIEPLGVDGQMKSALAKEDALSDGKGDEIESFDGEANNGSGDDEDGQNGDDITDDNDDEDDDGITDDNDDEDDGDITDDNDDEEDSKNGPDQTNGISAPGLNTGANHPFRY